MLYCIYETTNKINGKTYIGQHGYRNGKANDKYCGSGSTIKRAIKKYGRSSFDKRILIKDLISEDEANRVEIYYIALYKGIGKAEYNVSTGGAGPRGYRPSEEVRKKMSERMTGHIWSEESRHRLSKAIKGRKISEEQKIKISLANKGKATRGYGFKLSQEHKDKIRDANTGKKHSEETKKKLSDIQKGKRMDSDNIRSLKVICIETGIVYDSISKASLIINGSRKSTSINKVLSGTNKTAFGCHWKYL